MKEKSKESCILLKKNIPRVRKFCFEHLIFHFLFESDVQLIPNSLMWHRDSKF